MNVSTSQFHACAHPCVSLGGNIMPGPISESASVTQHITAAWSQPRRGGKKVWKDSGDAVATAAAVIPANRNVVDKNWLLSLCYSKNTLPVLFEKQRLVSMTCCGTSCFLVSCHTHCNRYGGLPSHLLELNVRVQHSIGDLGRKRLFSVSSGQSMFDVTSWLYNFFSNPLRCDTTTFLLAQYWIF